MRDLITSVRRSFVFPQSDEAGAGLVNKISSTIRRSGVIGVGLFTKAKENMDPKEQMIEEEEEKEKEEEEAKPIRWRKGELIGCGAFGTVYMGMNLDSGELLAVKQVSIAANGASRERTKAHVRELEEEVKLLKNLSHPNIVRYLGTAREDDAINILLEFVPGGSISSLLGKFGSFPESVIRMYTKQLLLGLEYLHKNGIMHRDIKGANILVDNKGCIKLADFGASKKVEKLATMTGAKSMKGTPYWMAPEVILQTGHSYSADIWSVGCTVIEMATGKPPWSDEYQEVSALYHVGRTKSHPPIPKHLSADAQDFLLKCLQKEPDSRSSAADLLQHPFVTAHNRESHHALRPSILDGAGNQLVKPATNHNIIRHSGLMTVNKDLKDITNMDSVRCSTIDSEKFYMADPVWGTNSNDDDMCQIDDNDDFAIGTSENMNSGLLSDDYMKSFNPMCEPTNDWPSKIEESSTVRREANLFDREASTAAGPSGTGNGEFSFPSEQLADDEEEVTESKIRAFLDEKALDLKKLQSPLVELYNTLHGASPNAFMSVDGDTVGFDLPSTSKSPSRMPSRRFSMVPAAGKTASPVRLPKRASDGDGVSEQTLKEVQSPKPSKWKELLQGQQESISSSASISGLKKKWKEELDEELDRRREMMRQAAATGKTSSPNNRVVSRPKDRLFASPAK